MRKKAFAVPYKRKRQGKTDYRLRLVILKSKLPRLVIRKSNKHILLQIVEYGEKGDKIIKSSHTKELLKYGWDRSTSNIPSAYLAGLLLGRKAKGTEVVIDIGLQSPVKGSKLFAAAKGAFDGGLKINFSEDVAPEEKKISGEQISANDIFLKVKEKILKD